MAFISIVREIEMMGPEISHQQPTIISCDCAALVCFDWIWAQFKSFRWTEKPNDGDAILPRYDFPSDILL